METSSAWPNPWQGFLDDAAIFPPGDAELSTALAAFTQRGEADSPYVGSLVVRDTDLPQVGDFDGPLSIVVTGGAGQIAGPVGLCAKRGLTIAGLEIALRDLDDLAGNARRVTAAVDAARADDLDPDVPIYVELPAEPPSYSWLAAADEIAAVELQLKFRTGGLSAEAFPSAETLTAWIDAALDREVPFKCTAGLHRAVRNDADGFAHHGFVNVLAATIAAFDGSSADETAGILRSDSPQLAADDVPRARRWFTSFGTCDIEEPLTDLRTLGLIA